MKTRNAGIGLLLATGLAAGCSALPPSRQYVDDLVQIERQVRDARLAELRQELGKKADAAATAAAITDEAKAREAALDVERNARKQAVSQLAAKLTGAEGKVAANAAAIAEMKDTVAVVKGGVLANASDIDMLKTATVAQAMAIAGTKQGLANEAKTREEVLRKEATERVKAVQAVQARTNKLERNRAEMFADLVRSSIPAAKQATMAFPLVGFTPGRADIEKVAAAKTNQSIVKQLTEGVEAGEIKVLGAVGTEDSSPCPADSNPLCKNLAEARAKATVEQLKLVVDDPDDNVKGYHRRSGDEFGDKFSSRRVLVYATTQWYYIKWQTTEDKTEAEALAKKLKEAGFSPTLESWETAKPAAAAGQPPIKVTKFQVSLGRKTKKEADAITKTLGEKKIPDVKVEKYN